MRLIHISDLHLSKISFHPRNLFSKRFLGTCNLLLRRKKNFLQQRLMTLFSFFDQLSIDALLVTGDLSSTSLKEEFSYAYDFLRELQKRKIRIFLLPGNHDMYTKKAFKQKSFYRAFAPFSSTLPERGLSSISLNEHWQLILLDAAKATSLFSSRGHFSFALEKELQAILSSLASSHVILACHFPFTSNSLRALLERKEALIKILSQFPQVKLYLHGHTHKLSFEDLRKEHLPIAIGAGSITLKQRSTFHLLEISPNESISSFFENIDLSWKCIDQKKIIFSEEPNQKNDKIS